MLDADSMPVQVSTQYCLPVWQYFIYYLLEVLNLLVTYEIFTTHTTGTPKLKLN